MENSFGEFLKQKRQEKNLTQKELSKLLFVSESAVSKWEKDVSHPDITLLPKLSEILGVTEHELITASVDKQLREEKVQAKKWRSFSMSWNLFFYIAYLITILTCFICNLAVGHTLSWFWIVVSALVLAFSFTNLPGLIKKHKLLLIPLSMLLALLLLLGVCCIYSRGDWFWIATLSIIFGFVIIFAPTYISNFRIFSKIKKYVDFVSVGVSFVTLNVLLVAINIYSVVNKYTSNKYWYFTIALPIVLIIYLILNVLMSVRFLKINGFLKTSIILLLINMILYVLPQFVKVENHNLQTEINQANIFKANFSNWSPYGTLENNIHFIVALSIFALAIIFLVVGLILHKRYKNKK